MIAQSFWFGGALSPYEWLSLQSFLDHGHGYHLYTYDPALAVPDGTVLHDAAEILPRDSVFLMRTGLGQGSVSIFADWFRYELLLQRGGWWVDTDVVCRAAALPEASLFFACEKPERVNCAILCFPPGHAVMRTCRDEAVRLGGDVAWGATGPRLLTAVLRAQGLLAQAHPPEVCYPFDWNELPPLYDPAQTAALKTRLEPALMLHLWNEMLRRGGINKMVGVPPGCYLDGLFRRHGVTFPSHPRYTAADILRLDENRRGVDRLADVEGRLKQLQAAQAAAPLPGFWRRLGRRWQTLIG